jgi:predicted permease
MNPLIRFVHKLSILFRSGRFRRELDGEMAFHRELVEKELMAEGMSAEDAHYAAMRQFGNTEKLRQQSQEAVAFRAETVAQDVRFALRQWARYPGFAFTAIFILALGIGANTAIFSIVDAVLLRPLPYRDGDRLVLVWQSSKEHRATGEWFNTYREFEEWKRNSRSFEKLVALTWAVSERTLVWRGKTQNILAIPTSVDFFSMLGVDAAIGRTFQQPDLNEGCTAILSHAFWQNELGAPADLIGRSIPLDQRECRIAGIMPKDFSFYPTQTALWTLITPNSEYTKDPWGSVTGVFGRLKPGVSRAAAEAELSTLEQNILPEAPKNLVLPQAVPVVLNLQSEFTWLAGRNLRTALIMLFAAVFFVLLIACVDVASLLLAHSADRQRELAIRASLGAGRMRQVCQLLVESTLLAAAGALLGTLFAFVTLELFRARNPIELPPGNPVRLDWQVLVFTAILAITSAVLFGLAPAWKATRLDLNEALKGARQNASHTRTMRRGGSLVIAGEVCLSLVLLAGAGLLIQSLARLAATPLGFRTDHLQTASVSLPKNRYNSPSEKVQFFERLTEQIGSIPGVQRVSIGSSFYLSGSNVLAVEGKPFSRASAPHNIAAETVDENFLQVMGIPLLQGRCFDMRDRANTAPVAMINQALAARYFPNQDSVGQQIKLGLPEDSKPWLTIIGVVGNVKTQTVFQEMGYVELPAVYRPLTQEPSPSMSLLVRTSDDPNTVGDPIREKLRALDSEATLANVKTMEERLYELQSQPRFRTILLTAFAALALILAAVGIYGVLLQSVVRRTKEIGVRMALGASRESVMQMILGQVLRTVLVGLVLGLLATLGLQRTVAGLLYNVNPANPATLATVSAVLVCVALLASYLPARRATSIDPLNALRNE